MHALSDYDYHLPPELIADAPAARRDDARLLVVNRSDGSLRHHQIRDLPDLLTAGDRLVLNDTRVVPARLFGRRTATGGKWEGLYLGLTPAGDWRLMGQCRGRLEPGETITLSPPTPAVAADASAPTDELLLELLQCDEDGVWTARPVADVDVFVALDRFGTVPLPPYIRRAVAPTDRERYQTVYAKRPGAVAAPTAGLHFTPELLDTCRNRGIDESHVTLHVGVGTFRPISVRNLDDHRMHDEWCEISDETAGELRATRCDGGRIVAVGTTTVRTLETAAAFSAYWQWRGETGIFIRPPYDFLMVDRLLTNFHLPKSSLLVLVSAFAGRGLIAEAYRCAIRERYRFYSYGDAMLIV